MQMIDAKGLNCPMPVVLAKKEIMKGESFQITVDNETAVENLKRLASSQGCGLEVNEASGGFCLTFTVLQGVEHAESLLADAVFIGKDYVGGGNEELGKALMKMFLYTLCQSENPPGYVLLMNAGVKLACEAETAAHLTALCGMGCKVLVCGTCLDFYGLKPALLAGDVSNMYDILSAMQSAPKVITV